MAKEAFLQFGGAALGTPAGPFQTVAVLLRETEAPRSGSTATGYGSALPTPYLVQWQGRWRRVRVACFSNSGTAYIGKPGAWLATVDFA
jgi:hypothetical protein